MLAWLPFEREALARASVVDFGGVKVRTAQMAVFIEQAMRGTASWPPHTQLVWAVKAADGGAPALITDSTIRASSGTCVPAIAVDAGVEWTMQSSRVYATSSWMAKDDNGLLALDFFGEPFGGEPLRNDKVQRASAGWIDYYYTWHRSNDVFYDYTSHTLGISTTIAYLTDLFSCLQSTRRPFRHRPVPASGQICTSSLLRARTAEVAVGQSRQSTGGGMRHVPWVLAPGKSGRISRCLRTAGRAIALFLFTFPFSAVPAPAQTVDLDRVMGGQERALRADVRGTGTFYGDCLEVTLTNDTGQPVTVNVPVGFLLVPASTKVQTMVAAGGESLRAPPGKSAHRIKAFCGESHDDVPGIGTPFSAGGRASGALLERVNEVREAGRFDRTGQDQIWQVTDTMDLSGGAGGVTAWETRGTVAAVLTALLLLGWQLLGDRINAPGVSPAPASDAAEGSSPEGSAAIGGVEIEPHGPESHDDRPAWSLVHRQSDDDLFDQRNECWVSRGSEDGRAILDARKREMADRGFDYDAERDAFIEQGLVYDEYSDSFRRPLDGADLLDILPEEGDASRMYYGPGWLFVGDPGTSSDPEVVNKNLNARRITWRRSKKTSGASTRRSPTA